MLFMNVLWMLFGGVLVALLYFAAGLICCLTIIGIPWGIQLFKLSVLALFPFGSEIHLRHEHKRHDSVNALLNIVWLLIGGIILLCAHMVIGVLLAITLIGIPFGVQHFKLARLAVWPFGHQIT